MAKLTKQEELFFKRVALKMTEGETIEQGMQSVLADDRRIFETFLTASDRARAEFTSGFAKDIYETIHAAQ